ncbi:hypothetical protein [Sorangium sp. So ce362]|uniref:hypothetical protein n=1 Tax=Sorangium sp. So ce362 TaxID=3133303 RepID=UPI003F60E76B
MASDRPRQPNEIEEEPEPPSERAPDPATSTPLEEVTWIVDKAVKKTLWRTDTGFRSRERAKRGVPAITEPLTQGGFPSDPGKAKEQIGGRFPKGQLLSDAEWSAFEQLSSTPAGQAWLNASGMLTHAEVERYLSGRDTDNPERFRGFHQVHKASKVVLASYVSRQMNRGEAGKRFEGTPPAALALSMEAKHAPDSARRAALQQRIDQSIVDEWSKTLEYTDPNDDASTAIDKGAVPDPQKKFLRPRKTLSKEEVVDRHRQSLDVLKNVFHLLQEGAEIYDDSKKSHVPLQDVPVAKLLSHGGRVNVQIPAGSPPYALTELLGITDSNGDPASGVFKRAFGTHHIELDDGKFKEQGGHGAAIRSKIDDTELYGINLAVGGLGLKDFNGDVILPDGAHGHMFIGYRPPKPDRPGALQIGMETTGPGAPSTVGYVHNWRSTEKTANPISSVGGLKADKIGDEQIKNARTVDLSKLGDDWATTLRDRADRFEQELAAKGKDALNELVGPRTQPPQELEDARRRSGDPELADDDYDGDDEDSDDEDSDDEDSDDSDDEDSDDEDSDDEDSDGDGDEDYDGDDEDSDDDDDDDDDEDEDGDGDDDDDYDGDDEDSEDDDGDRFGPSQRPQSGREPPYLAPPTPEGGQHARAPRGESPATSQTSGAQGKAPERPGQPRPETTSQSPAQRSATPATAITTGMQAPSWLGKKLGTGGHGFAGMVSNEGAAQREQALADKYKLQIGPDEDADGTHFSHKMLDHIEKALGELPTDDVTGSPTLRKIIRDLSSEQSASEYDEDTDTINIVNPEKVPTFVYSRLNRRWDWQRKRMDRGAMRGYPGVSKEQDDALGITGRRQVMGGVSDALATGNLLKWTIRHEVAHSIDKLVDWNSLASDDRFGGWQEHSNSRELQVVADAIFAKAGISDDKAQQKIDDEGQIDPTGAPLIERFASLLDPEQRREDMTLLENFPAKFTSTDPDLKDRLERVVRTVKIAMAQPWTLVDGGARELQVEDRIYHVDHYDKWVSYRADARNNAVSNYQFSTPKEWFAETYASYHDPDPRPKAQLTQDVRDFFQNELPGLIITGRDRWQRSRDRIAQRAGNKPPQPPAAGSSAAGPSAAGPSAVTVGFSKNTPTVAPSSGSHAASPPHDASGAPKDSSTQETDGANENLGDPQAALQALLETSNTWSHPATDADKQDAKRLLGDLMRSQGVDKALVDRLAELIDNPDSLSQHQFATCALNSVLHTQLTSDLAGFAHVVAAEFTGKLFDRNGKLLADFSLDTQGENDATASAQPADPILRVIRGDLPLQDAPIGNKLLQNGVKKAAARRADLERKGSAFSDAHVLDYLLARGLGKMLSKLAPEQYQADVKYTAGVIPGYHKAATRAKDAKGPSKKHGDLLLSADSLVTLFTDILGGNAQTMVTGDNYDVGRINDVLTRPGQAPFVLATFLDGNGLAERADAFAKDPTKAKPFDTVGNIGTSSAHQVVINGKITEDGDHYVVPMHTWQQSFSIKVKKDALPSLFPVFTYGNYLPSGAPGANDASQSLAPENNAWTQLTTGGNDKLGTGGHGVAGLVSNKGAAAREQALARQYNLQIGPGNDAGGKHFSHKMLDRIEKVLGELPPDHVTGNPTLRTIIRDISSEQSASAYDELTDTINVVNPYDMPSWLYSRLNRSVSWQRYLMDRGAKSDYDGISKQQDKELGIAGRRQVMAGVSDVLANGNLVKWTMRHEIGHSIDKLIDWRSLAEDDKFGGWKVHSDTQDFEDVTRAIFAKAGITDDEANTEIDGFSVLQRFASVLDAPSLRKDMAPLVEFPASAAPRDADLREKLEKAVRTVKIAMAQPWTLDDAGASELQVDGRIYHVDQYNQWVSYRADARNDAVSNYQFSTPAEWFAEAYASYYDPDPAPKAKLTQDVRDFFENELPDLVTRGHETWQRIRENIARSAAQQPQEGSSASAITSGFNPEASVDPADLLAGYNPDSDSEDEAADPLPQTDEIEEEPEPPSERAPDPATSTPLEEVTWIVDKAVKKTLWRTDTGFRSRERAKRAVPAITELLTQGGFPADPGKAKELIGGRFPKGQLLSDAEWSAFEQLSSTPAGQSWLNASGMLTHDEVERYLSGRDTDNPERFRGFHQLHKATRVVLASYVSRQMNRGEAGKRFEGTPPAAVALSMEARHTTDLARRDELKRLIDQSIVEEWSKTLEYTEPNDDASTAIDQGAVPDPKKKLLRPRKTLSKKEVVDRHRQSLEVLKNVFHLLQEGAEIYDDSTKRHVPPEDVPVAKLLSHGGRVNIQIPAGSPPYALTELLGITDKDGKPEAGVFKRFVGTHHVALGKGKFKEQGGQPAALMAKIDDTELYGINLAVGGLGLKDFNGDVILPDGAHGHMFIGYRPPKPGRPGALQIGMETTGPGAPSTVGYVHNWRSTEKTANPISSVGGLKADKIGDEQIKNARTVDLSKLGNDWATTLKDRADRFEQDLKQKGKDALNELVGPRTQPPQELQDAAQRAPEQQSGGPEQEPRDNERRDPPGDATADLLAGYNPDSDSEDEAADPQTQTDEIEDEPEPPSERAPDPTTSTPIEEVTWIVDKAVKKTLWRTDTGIRSRERAKRAVPAITEPLTQGGFPADPGKAKELIGGRFPKGQLLSDAEWSAFEQLSSTPAGQSWLNASGMLTHDEVERYLSGRDTDNPERFRGFHQLHKATRVVLASYVSRQMNRGEAGKRFEGTPPAALALSMEARHTTDAARRDELKRLIDQSIVEEWSKTLEYTAPNDDASTAIDKGAVLDPKKKLLRPRATLSKEEVVDRHRQSLDVLKNVFHLLQEGAEIYDDSKKSHVPLQDVPVAKLLSHGGRVNVQIPAGSPPYALTELLGITDKDGKPKAGVFKRFVGTHHVALGEGKFKEQGGQPAAFMAKLDDTELYGINLAVGGLGLKDFNGDVILPDGAHGHMFLGYRPPKPGRPGALQIGMETTGPGAPSTVGYVHNWRSTEKTANPISSVGGLKADKIGDEQIKNARTVDLSKLGDDWATILKERADRFEQDLALKGKDALNELVGPRTQPPQELQDAAQRASEQQSGGPEQEPRDNERRDPPGDAPADLLAGYNPDSDSEDEAADPLPQTDEIEEAPEPPSERAPDPATSTPLEEVTWIVDKAVKKTLWRTDTGFRSRERAKRAVPAITEPLTQGGFPADPGDAKTQIGGRFPKGQLLSDAEWSAFEQLSSTPAGQSWLNASGMLTHDEVERYLSGRDSDNPERFRGFHQLHKATRVVLASYVSRQMNRGEAGKRFEGTPPAALALSMEAKHAPDSARRAALQQRIDQSIVEEWSKTLEYTEPNDDASTAIDKGAVPDPQKKFLRPRKTLSKKEVVDRHRQSLEVLKSVFHLLQEGAEIYDDSKKSHVPLQDVPVAKLLSHGGRVNVQIPAGSPPYALTELLGITDSNGDPASGVFKRAFGTHHIALDDGNFKEQGGHGAAIKSKLDDTELYGINLAVGGLGLKDFNGDVILPDGAHGHMFIGYRPPKPGRPGALQIGMETTGPGAPSTVGYVHNWRSTEKTANPISSVGGLKADKIGDEQIKNARTVDLSKLGDDWATTLKDRADRFEQDLALKGKDALNELVGPRTQPPQELQAAEQGQAPQDAEDDGVDSSGDLLAGAPAPDASPSPAPTTAGATAQVEPSPQYQGKTLDDLLSSLDEQSRAWSHPATDENKKEANQLLTGLLQQQNVHPSVTDRLRELIDNPGSLSQSAFTNCVLHSVLYPTLKNDLATTSHLVAALFTGKLLGKLASASGASTFGPQGSGKPLSDSLDLIRRVMTGDVPQALGPAPTRPLVNGLRTARAKDDSLKGDKGRKQLDRHLLDHLLARGLVEMLGADALAKLEQQTDGVKQPGVAAAQGDLLASAKSVASLFNSALGANATVVTHSSPGGYDVARFNEALQQTDQAGFAIATLTDGKALWNAAKKHEASSRAPHAPGNVARLGKATAITPHHAAIDGPITDHGDSFIVPLQSWGRTFPVQINKEDMPRVFAAITFGTALPSRAPSPSASAQEQAGADTQAGYNPDSDSEDEAADPQPQTDEIEDEPEPPSERAPDPTTSTPIEEVTWIVDKAVKKTLWRTDTGIRSRERAKRAVPAITEPLTQGGFPADPGKAKELIGGRFPKGQLLSDAEWSAFEQLSSTPAGQSWLNASGMLTHDEVERYLSGRDTDNPERFRGFHQLHKATRVVLASYVSRQMNRGEAGKRFEGTPPAAVALSMEARHTTDLARRDELKRLIDQSIVEEWSKTLEYTEPNDDASTAIDQGAVPDPKKKLLRPRKTLSKKEVVDRHRQSLEVLKNVFHLLQEGAEIYDDSTKRHVPPEDVPVAKLLSHGGRVNIQIPAGSPPYALTELLGITDKDGKPEAGVFKRFVGTHHVALGKGKFKEQGGQPAALMAKLDDTELYGINLAVGGLGLKDFNGDVILPDGAHGHMFIGYRPPKPGRPGALQIGMETTGPGAPSTVGYVHNWRSTEKTANPISSVGGLKADKIGDENIKNARTVDLSKLGNDWATTLKDRADRFEQDLAQKGKDALNELVGPRTQPPQELQDAAQRASEQQSGGPEQEPRDNETREPPGDAPPDTVRSAGGTRAPAGADGHSGGQGRPPPDAPADLLAGYNPASDSEDEAADPQPQTDEIEEEPEPPSERAPDPATSTPIEEVTWIVDKAVKKTLWRTDTGIRSRERAKRAVPAITEPLTQGGFPADPGKAKELIGGRFPKGQLLSDAEWSAFEQLSSTPAGQSWLNASGMLTHDEVERYLSGRDTDNPERFRGFHQLHKATRVVLASYVSRQMNRGEAGKRFEGTPPAALALSMEAKHAPDSARRAALQQRIDQSIVEEWSKTLEYTEPNDDASTAIDKGAVLDPKKKLLRPRKTLSKKEVVDRHRQSLEVLKNVFHLLQEGAEIYDDSTKRHVPPEDVPVAKLLSHGGRVNIQIPAGSPPYALTELLGITDKDGKPEAGVFKRFVGTHHVALGKGKFKEQGGQPAALMAKLDDTELYGINLAVGGLGLKDFNGDVILPDGAHGHMFIGYRPPKPGRPGALQIGMETTGPGAPSTVGYVHNWRSTEKTANPISSVGGLKADKIGDEQIKNARTVDLSKLGNDWATTLRDRADRFEQDLKQKGKDALNELVGPRTQPPQELQDAQQRSGDPEQAPRNNEPGDTPGDTAQGARAPANTLAGYNPVLDGESVTADPLPHTGNAAQVEPSPRSQGKTLDDLLSSLDEQSGAWSAPANDSLRQEAADSLAGLLESLNVDRAIVDRLRELIENPASLSQSAFSNCALHSALYTMLKGDLATTSHLVVALFTGRLLGRLAQAPGARELGAQQSAGRAVLSEDLDIIRRVMTGEIPRALGPAPTRPLVNGLKTAGAKRGGLTRATDRQQLDRHLLDHLLARGLVELLGQDAVAQHGKRTDRARQRDVVAAQGDLLLSANSMATLMSDALGAEVAVKSGGLSEGDVAHINETLRRTDRAGFAVATVANGKALWEAAKRHRDGGALTPHAPASVAPLGEGEAESRHHLAIDGEITVDGDAFIVPVQSWGQSFPIRVQKADMPRLFEVITLGTYPPPRAPALDAPTQQQAPAHLASRGRSGTAVDAADPRDQLAGAPASQHETHIAGGPAVAPGALDPGAVQLTPSGELYAALLGHVPEQRLTEVTSLAIGIIDSQLLPQILELLPIGLRPATRLAEEIVAKWLAFNPDLLDLPAGELKGRLAAHAELVLGMLERDRGRSTIGRKGGSSAAAPAASAASSAPQPPEGTPAPQEGFKDRAQESSSSTSSAADTSSDAGAPGMTTEPEGYVSLFADLEDSDFGVSAEEHKQKERAARNQEKLEKPARGEDPQKRAIPEWIWGVPHYAALQTALLAHFNEDAVQRALAELLATTESAETPVPFAEFVAIALKEPHDAESLKQESVKLFGSYQGEMRQLVYDATKALGALDWAEHVPDFDIEALREPPPPPPTGDAEPPRSVLKRGQEGRWVTRAELEIINRSIGERAFAGMLARAMNKGKISGTRATIEQLVRQAERLADPALSPPLTSTSLVVDTNLVEALLTPPKELPLSKRYLREQLDVLIREHRITDLRLANINIGELFQHDSIVGRKFTTSDGREIPWYGIRVDDDRRDDMADYALGFEQLASGSVGEKKGSADRSMVADAFFSDREDDKDGAPAVPHFATADHGILTPLLSFAGIDAKRRGEKAFIDFVKENTKENTRNGTPYFEPELKSRKLKAHTILNLETGGHAAAKDAQPAQSEPIGAALLDTPVGATHRVHDLISLIRAFGFDVYIVGGAVRDALSGKKPKDVDLKTNMPMSRLEEVLRTDPAFKSLPVTVVPELRLLQVGGVNTMVDITSGDDTSVQGPLDVMADAQKRDFRMNALYLDENGFVVDPLDGAIEDQLVGRLRFVADPGPTAPVEERQKAVVEHLRRTPWNLGRALKFYQRGYELEPEILHAVLDNAESILASMKEREAPLHAKSLVLHATRAESPTGLAEIMQVLGFSPQAIREIIPDDVAGRFDDESLAYENDVLPRWRETPDDDGTGYPLAAPEMKIDLATGRIYQYRFHAIAPQQEEQAGERVIIDVDLSDHNQPGHHAPHYHVYRWRKRDGQFKWDKKKNGFSDTGQPGLPEIADGRYLGPQPWRFEEGLDSGDLLSVRRRINEAGIELRSDGDLLDLGGQVKLHPKRLQELVDRGQLGKLLMLVKNLNDGIPWSSRDQATVDLSGSHRGQERLRFKPQLSLVVPFLRDSGIEDPTSMAIFAENGEMQHDALLRLYDLVSGEERSDLRRPAAAFARERAESVSEFVERFEFYVATMKGNLIGADVEALWQAQLKAAQEANAVGNVTLRADGELTERLAEAASELRFETASAAAYHAAKHGDEFLTPEERAASVQPKDAVRRYLDTAREAVRKAVQAGALEARTDETGATNIVLWDGTAKVIVRVGPDGTAHILSSYVQDRRNTAPAAAFTRPAGTGASLSGPRSGHAATHGAAEPESRDPADRLGSYSPWNGAAEGTQGPQAPQATGAPATLDGDVTLRAPIDALVRTLVAKSRAWSSPRTLADKQEAITLVTELLQQLGMDAKVVDRAGEQGKDAPDDEHSACTCVR